VLIFGSRLRHPTNVQTFTFNYSYFKLSVLLPFLAHLCGLLKSRSVDALNKHQQTLLTISDDRDKGAVPGGDLSTSYHVTSLQIFFVCSCCSVMPFIPGEPPLPSPTDTSNNTSLPHQHLATKNLENSQIWSKARLHFLHLTPYQSLFFLFLLLSLPFFLLQVLPSPFNFFNISCRKE
jgi:hypothetical protein